MTPAFHPEQSSLEKAVRSRPSKTNCTTADNAAETPEPPTRGTDARRRKWWKRKNEIVDEFLERRPDRAARPTSVRDDVKIRDDTSLERNAEEGTYRAATWSSTLREFLTWYNGYREAHLKFKSPEGEEVRAQMPNSHQPRYGDTYYARLKALERQLIDQYDDPHLVMLTFTGSNRNAKGGWRCPGDHLRDVINAWRPDRGRGVYHALRGVLDGEEWEYALVTEHHDSGYGHVHCAVFVDGEVSEEDFHPVIDAHLRNCEIAGKEAHNYHHDDEDKRPISVNSVDPDLDLDDLDPNSDDVEDVGNLGSYIGEYIGSYGEELFDRTVEELQFRAVSWATGTQRVRFSNGANEVIDQEIDRDDGDQEEPIVVYEPDPDEPDESPWKVHNEPWSLEAICRIEDDAERHYDDGTSAVQWVTVEPAPKADPRPKLPPDRPLPPRQDADLKGY